MEWFAEKNISRVNRTINSRRSANPPLRAGHKTRLEVLPEVDQFLAPLCTFQHFSALSHLRLNCFLLK
ncbi:uncharacterized protein ASCRUDRAFT_76633 [Ascoidea rubescens DSM 1968]|uniref:Uncharacterized protein n=1 Tax=Ascoidea rubescens DSM 1968 TaxID=1344418 RepID=A0A1D2VEP5_9ASCO|nr:hypothetical protein ASCRUDRAFT_76633 [Ascoidea rubescens DSM 1968]ODV60121.1 hypothetical protein ASCRUDRAFT_76633 [Ascoidea rubescens DSM 1968]